MYIESTSPLFPTHITGEQENENSMQVLPSSLKQFLERATYITLLFFPAQHSKKKRFIEYNSTLSSESQNNLLRIIYSNEKRQDLNKLTLNWQTPIKIKTTKNLKFKHF